MNIKT